MLQKCCECWIPREPNLSSPWEGRLLQDWLLLHVSFLNFRCILKHFRSVDSGFESRLELFELLFNDLAPQSA